MANWEVKLFANMGGTLQQNTHNENQPTAKQKKKPKALIFTPKRGIGPERRISIRSHRTVNFVQLLKENSGVSHTDTKHTHTKTRNVPFHHPRAVALHRV